MKNTGVELWKEAKGIIPGGNQLLSKRSEMFLPDQWPSYYKRAKGCEIWDLDDNHYYDFAQMGVGSCILGYADDDVNGAVIDAVNNGSMSSLNSFEEVQLAKTLIEMHPWAEMVRFTRTGGEACAVAIRIARAATGRSKVAFCGYHGWHDWYISSNLGSLSNLDEQLLPGLKPAGVPRELYDTALPFRYNNLEDLLKLVQKNGKDIAAIIMEPQRSTAPNPEFLKGVRDIARQVGAVLIFDEVTSGFRMNVGGIHLILGVHPDLAVFGKALGNGFPIAAIIGKREIMDNAQNSFISSTFWTERIGYVAALATIKKIKEHGIPAQLVKWGDRINEIWKLAAGKHGINIHISGISPLTHIEFNYKEKLAIQTLYAQILLEKGFLLGASVYATAAYNDQVLDGFAQATDEAFHIISHAIEKGDVVMRLKGGIKHSGFARLT